MWKYIRGSSYQNIDQKRAHLSQSGCSCNLYFHHRNPQSSHTAHCPCCPCALDWVLEPCSMMSIFGCLLSLSCPAKPQRYCQMREGIGLTFIAFYRDILKINFEDPQWFRNPKLIQYLALTFGTGHAFTWIETNNSCRTHANKSL